MTVAFVPTLLEFSLESLLGIQARLSDAAIVRYEGAGDVVGSVWTFFVVIWIQQTGLICNTQLLGDLH